MLFCQNLVLQFNLLQLRRTKYYSEFKSHEAKEIGSDRDIEIFRKTWPERA